MPEERARRLKIEVDRLANLPVVEWMYYLADGGVAEKHGVSRVAMKAMVEATIRAIIRNITPEQAQKILNSDGGESPLELA